MVMLPTVNESINFGGTIRSCPLLRSWTSTNYSIGYISILDGSLDPLYWDYTSSYYGVRCVK